MYIKFRSREVEQKFYCLSPEKNLLAGNFLVVTLLVSCCLCSFVAIESRAKKKIIVCIELREIMLSSTRCKILTKTGTKYYDYETLAKVMFVLH